MQKRYWMAADCPNCGEKDAPDQWKGARMTSTEWGHGFSCCSDKCGFEYANSPKRWRREIAMLDEKISGWQDRRREYVKRLGLTETQPVSEAP